MATWVIGDVHGCANTLDALLAALPRSSSDDRLVFVGDVVNRGLHSAAVLDTIERLGASATVVLGNHEVHLLTRAFRLADARRGDTLDDVLRAPWCGDWVDRLREAPLLALAGDAGIVHAGLAPWWSDADAIARAADVRTALRGPSCEAVLRANIAAAAPAHRPGSDRPRDDAALLPEDLASWLALFTRVRMLGPTGLPDASFKGPPHEAPPPLTPWFVARPPSSRRWVFGHWAALGAASPPTADTTRRWICVDTGAVWGERLTALRVDDLTCVSVPTDSRDLPRR